MRDLELHGRSINCMHCKQKLDKSDFTDDYNNYLWKQEKDIRKHVMRM